MRDTPSDTHKSPIPFPGELLIWLSPAFPIGGFAYSQGLEAAVDRGWVTNAPTLTKWLDAIIRHGALGNDLIIMSLMLRASEDTELQALCELSNALQPSAERAREALDQGRAFRAAYLAAWSPEGVGPTVLGGSAPITLPVAVALAARNHALDPAATLEAYGIAFSTNLVSAAIRLSVVGQFDAQRIMADLLPMLRQRAAAARFATLEDLGTATYGADLAAMLHETQTTRLFRS